MTFGDVPKVEPGTKADKPQPDVERFKVRPGVRVFRRHVSEDGWIPQDWTFYLAPVADGVEMLLVVKLEGVGLPEFYGVQQCFRLTGAGNGAWRQKYARTPAFSEFDLWKGTPAGAEPPSLTWALRNGSLLQLPAGRETVGCRTPDGKAMDTRRSGGHLETLGHIGPYQRRNSKGGVTQAEAGKCSG